MAITIDRTATLDSEMFSQLTEELGSEGVASLVQMFSERGAAVAELRHAIGAHDGTEVARLAHSLKGGASTMAATRLAKLAAAIEECGLARSFEAAELLTREAGGEFDRAIAQMNAALEPAPA